MERLPVQSSNVSEVGYDPATMTMEVAFTNGSVYQYFDVPEAVFQELLSAESIGTFIHEQVKNMYRYARM